MVTRNVAVIKMTTKLLFQRCMNLLDVGARESLSDVISKVLRKVANQPEGKDEELDDTLLTWLVVVWEWELTRDLHQCDECQMPDDCSVPFLFKQDSSETCFDADRRLKRNRDECHFLSLEPASHSHSICKLLYSVVKLLMFVCKRNFSWAGALLRNSSLSVFFSFYLNIDDIADIHVVPLSHPSTVHTVSFS